MSGNNQCTVNGQFVCDYCCIWDKCGTQEDCQQAIAQFFGVFAFFIFFICICCCCCAFVGIGAYCCYKRNREQNQQRQNQFPNYEMQRYNQNFVHGQVANQPQRNIEHFPPPHLNQNHNAPTYYQLKEQTLKE